MKTSLKIFALGLILAGFGVNANAQSGTSTVSSASTAAATVVKTLTIAETQALNFGTFAGIGTGSTTVIVNTEGGRTGTADLLAGGVAVKAANFTITGEPGAIVAVTMPAGSTFVPYVSGGTTGFDMSIDGGATGWSTNATAGNVTLVAGTGTFALKVGATLNVGTSQAVGLYQGTFTVSINYN